MAKTIQQRLTEALEKRGCERVRGYVGKYRKMTCVDLARNVEPGKFYFIGSSGALRVGPSASDSLSLTDSTFYKRLLAGL